MGLREAGVDSRMFVCDKRSDDPSTVELKASENWFGLRRILGKVFFRAFSIQDYRFQNQCLSAGIDATDLCGRVQFTPDVIIVHYLSNFMSWGDVLELQRATNAPVVFNLLDMGSLTGGCHYAWSCDRYESECGNCPALRFNASNDFSATTMVRKRSAVAKMELVVVAGSTYLEKQARRSAVFGGRQTETILIGVDPEVYRQRDRKEARKLLGIPAKNRTILFGAQSAKDKRKGYEWLIRSLEELATNPGFKPGAIQVVTIGKVQESRRLRASGYSQVPLGTVKDESRLVLSYQAADVLACPSIQDSGPAMINESLMCGTPVVAFEMGVARDLIETARTGYVARLEDYRDFASGLQSLLELSEDKAARMSAQCRTIALEKSSMNAQIGRFTKVIGSLSAGRPGIEEPGSHKASIGE